MLFGMIGTSIGWLFRHILYILVAVYALSCIEETLSSASVKNC